ncbi:RdRP-domain-containing protein [Auricularia subglabra TFB-10046 SS5]|nr:RdRP-domain-containing protein [Auricularia subglabra TFB-10046 SS5]
MDQRGGLVKERIGQTAARLSVTPNEDIVLSATMRKDDESRATRWVDDPARFMVVTFDSKAESYYLGPEGLPRLLELMRHGLETGGSRFSFLGFTESQLGAGALLFFEEGDGYTIDSMLEYFGELEPVFVKSGYGKYAARLGLSFSSTKPVYELSPSDLISIDDRFALDGTVTTDGCGLIKDSLARQLCILLGIANTTAIFQVRIGGIKGVLARYPDDVFERLAQNSVAVIAYRPSMFKYRGGPQIVELNKISKTRPDSARLNIQFILLLLTLGVGVEVFQQLLSIQLERIDNIFSDRKSAIAFLENAYDVTLDSNATRSLYQDAFLMLHAGFDLSEPQLQWSLNTLRTQMLKRLQDKLQIEVQDSAMLFGVCDETNSLEEDEVYVNLPERGGGFGGRTVVVMKNPAYAPGDIRVFKAVDRPSLRICPTNCIVFASSARCGRSPADKMSGGDLDGDTFFVSWDSSLIPSRVASPQPRPKPIPPLQPPPRGPILAEAAKTFIALHNKMLLGQMSNSWKETAENSADIAQDKYCLQLVPMIEAALDITKTGEDVDQLAALFRRTRFRSGQRSQGCISHLAPLREMITIEPKATFEHWRCDAELVQTETMPLAEWERHTREGAAVMPKFNAELAKALSAGNDELPYQNAASQRQTSSDSRTRVDETRDRFIERYFGGKTLQDRNSEAMRAVAWYKLGYGWQKQSFAWLGLRYLCRLKALARHGAGEIVSVGPMSAPLNPSKTAPASVPSTLGGTWTVVSRTSSIESLGSDTLQPALAELLLGCMELGHSFSLNADATMRRFKCATCGESRVERVRQQ